MGTTPHKGVAPELAVSVLISTLIGYQPNGVERSKIQLELSMQDPECPPLFHDCKTQLQSTCVKSLLLFYKTPTFIQNQNYWIWVVAGLKFSLHLCLYVSMCLTFDQLPFLDS